MGTPRPRSGSSEAVDPASGNSYLTFNTTTYTRHTSNRDIWVSWFRHDDWYGQYGRTLTWNWYAHC
jgi:hypothetical protein